jgi:hypothetical protein
MAIDLGKKIFSLGNILVQCRKPDGGSETFCLAPGLTVEK